MRLEDASPRQRWLFEEIQRLCYGYEPTAVGSVAISLVLAVIRAEVPEGDTAAADAFIDEVAESLKRAVRAQYKRDRESLQ